MALLEPTSHRAVLLDRRLLLLHPRDARRTSRAIVRAHGASVDPLRPAHLRCIALHATPVLADVLATHGLCERDGGGSRARVSQGTRDPSIGHLGVDGARGFCSRNDLPGKPVVESARQQRVPDDYGASRERRRWSRHLVLDFQSKADATHEECSAGDSRDADIDGAGATQVEAHVDGTRVRHRIDWKADRSAHSCGESCGWPLRARWLWS